MSGRTLYDPVNAALSSEKLGKAGSDHSTAVDIKHLFSGLFIDDAICNNIYLSLRPFMLTSVNTCCFYSSRINLANT